MRLMTDVERMGHQYFEIEEPDLLSTFEYRDARITKVQNQMVFKRNQTGPGDKRDHMGTVY